MTMSIRLLKRTINCFHLILIFTLINLYRSPAIKFGGVGQKKLTDISWVGEKKSWTVNGWVTIFSDIIRVSLRSHPHY